MSTESQRRVVYGNLGDITIETVTPDPNLKGRVIGLCGPSRAGKNTLATIVAEEYPSLIVAAEGFSDRLKVSAALALGFTGTRRELIASMDMLKVCGGVETRIEHGPHDVQESYVNGRRFLQLYGTEAHREVFGDDFWVNAVLPDPSAPFAGRTDIAFDYLFLTDVRFPNEAERILASGGAMWRVEREETVVTGHVSEVPIPDSLVSRTIRNTGTLDDLRCQVRAAMGEPR